MGTTTNNPNNTQPYTKKRYVWICTCGTPSRNTFTLPGRVRNALKLHQKQYCHSNTGRILQITPPNNNQPNPKNPAIREWALRRMKLWHDPLNNP